MKTPPRIAALFLLAALPSAQAASILLVRAGGTTAAHETDMINLLEAAGHDVTAVQQGTDSGQIGGALTDEYQPGQTRSEFLNTFEGIIVPRVSQSGNFNDKAGWASLTTGVLVASPFSARGSSGNGMGLFAGAVGSGFSFNALGNPDVTVLNAGHEIWAGVNITEGSANLWVETDTAGQVHGSLGSVGDGLILGHRLSNNTQNFLTVWETGDALGGTETLAGGRRVAFSLAEGDATTSNTTSLTADGETAFVNAVNWMVVPEPSSAALVLAGALALGLRRRRN